MPDELVVALIDKVYAAAENAALWPNFLDAFADAIASAQTVLVFRDMQTAAGSTGFGVRMDPYYAALYEHYAEENFFLTAGAPLLKTGAIITSDSLYDDSEILRRSYYHEYLKPQNIFHSVDFVVSHDERTTANLIAMRPRNRGVYGEEEIRIGRALMPHLQRAYSVHKRLSSLTASNEIANASLDVLRSGVVALDSTGRIRTMNAAAGRMLNGPHLVVSSDRLVATNDSGALDAALRAAREAGCCAPRVVQIPRGDRRSLALTIIPVTACESHPDLDRSVVVFIDDPEIMAMADPCALRKMFGVSSAEARLANLLLKGQSVFDCAETLNVSPHTVRTQLKQLLAKTGTKRQSELLLLLERTFGRLTQTESSTPSRGTATVSRRRAGGTTR